MRHEIKQKEYQEFQLDNRDLVVLNSWSTSEAMIQMTSAGIYLWFKEVVQCCNAVTNSF